MSAMAGLLLCATVGSRVAAPGPAGVPGCFVDSRASRQLAHQVCLVDGGCAQLSRFWCSEQCASLGFALAGVEASHQCCCGNKLRAPTAVAPRSECNETCTGNASETCGGSLRLWVFPSGSIPPPPPPPPPPALPLADPRYIPGGRVIVTGGYACQPYCVVLNASSAVSRPSDRPASAPSFADTPRPRPSASEARSTGGKHAAATGGDGEGGGSMWTCVMTYNTESYVEGAPGEHMVSMQTRDQGKTWTPLTTLEPFSTTTTAQVSAYGSIGARPDGSRLFAYWIQNVGNVSHIPNAAPSATFRADMLGQFVWRFSDDQGATWSDQHYVIPVPERAIDRNNTWMGGVQIMWQVDHMKITSNGSALFGFTKIGKYPIGAPEEIYFMHSGNLLSEPDPTKVEWEMWPSGDHGVEAIGGTTSDPSGITEEPHIVPLTSINAYAVVFRTSQGYLGYSRSAEGDPTAQWRASAAAQYLPPPVGDDWLARFPNASGLKNPRGPISPKRQSNGVVLMTFYNNAGFGKFAQHTALSDRNHMWLTAGHEVAGELRFTQPELVLYDRNRSYGHGYPDILTDGGAYFITETYKSKPGAEAKTHAVPTQLVQLLYAQRTLATVAPRGLAAALKAGATLSLPAGTLPDFRTYPTYRYGFSIDVWVGGAGVSGGVPHGPAEANAAGWSALTTAMDHGGTQTVALEQHQNGTARLTLTDKAGRLGVAWTDPVCSAQLASAGSHYLAVVVDGGPRMVLWVVDGHVCDGGPMGSGGWAAGWSLFDDAFGDVGGGAGNLTLSVGSGVKGGRLYSTALHTSESIGNWRAEYGKTNP